MPAKTGRWSSRYEVAKATEMADVQRILDEADQEGYFLIGYGDVSGMMIFEREEGHE